MLVRHMINEIILVMFVKQNLFRQMISEIILEMFAEHNAAQIIDK